ncbi:MAG: hypothetical protein KF878_06875 [Planctomycetes bacterium]|nr:hypothetical protein [Planctomycetota bacterium]
MKPLRVSRRRAWLPLVAAAPLALGLGWPLLVALDGHEAPAPAVAGPRVAPPPVEAPAPAPAPAGPREDPAALSRAVVDPARGEEERTDALRRLARAADDARPVLEVLHGTPAAEDPFAAQVRAMALTALARHPDDPAARAAVLEALEPTRPREERLLALSVVRSMLRTGADGGWARPALESLGADPDGQLNAAARAALGDRP